MSSAPLQHNLVKFADSGLQLRLPVDLIPPTQYGQLTNSIPIIEGELRTREGVTLLAVFTVGFTITKLLRSFTPGLVADTIFLNTNTNLFAGQTVIVTITDGEGFFTNGTYITVIASTSATNPITVFPYLPAPGFTSAGADLAHAAVGTVNIVGSLSEAFIHTIHRLNQSATSLTSERIVGAGICLFAAPLPGDNAYTQIGAFLSGHPLSVIDFRFTLDTATWMIFTDEQTMYKYRNPYLFLLGNPFPTVPAAASVGGAGNLDSTGGADYDWRYTYFDGYVSTEGNPSPSPDSGTIEVKTSTSQTNPNPAHNTGGAFPYVNAAFVGVSNTGGNITIQQDGGSSPPTANFFVQCSCIWKGFANPSTTPFVNTLTITWQATVVKPSAAPIQVDLQYSIDGGASFTTFASTNVTVGSTVSTVNLPLGTNYTQLQFQAYGFCNPNDIPPFKPGGSLTFTITNIEVDANLSPTATTLALANKQALVCVKGPVANDGRITAIRLYRRGGTLPDNWRLVGTFPLAGLVQGGCGVGLLQITDNVGDAILADQPILELDNDQPVTSVSVLNQAVKFFWGPAGIEARVLACGDPARPESVYFSKPGNADAWPPQNHVEVCSPGTPVIAGCIFNTRIYAYSNEGIYELVEGLNPSAVYTPFPTPATHGLISPWGLVAATAMYFVAKDGIYMSDGGKEQSIVENDIKPLFPTYDSPGQDVEGYEAVDMAKTDSIRLEWHNDELWFLYAGLTTGIRQTLIYDTLKKRWRAAHYTSALSTIYSEPATVSSLLLGTTAGGLYRSLGTHDPNQLDVIENAIIQQVNSVPTIPAGSYFAVLTRSTSAGEVAISFIVGPIVVNVNHTIQCIIPLGPPGTVSWRLYFGTDPTNLNQYQQVLESSLGLIPAARTIYVFNPGTAGTPPTVPPSSDIVVQLRTGAHDQGAPLNRKQYDNVIFDLDPGGADVNFPVTITPFINGEVAQEAAITVTGNGRQQVPLDLSDFFAFNVEYQVEWAAHTSDPVLFQYDTLWYVEPVGLKHWEQQPSSWGFPGFMHTRDAYIAIRSTADVTLTLTLDEGTDAAHIQTYTLPSTGGARKKLYVQFHSNKWLELKLGLDSTEEFRVYEADLELRVKPWLGTLGYQISKPFAEVG